MKKSFSGFASMIELIRKLGERPSGASISAKYGILGVLYVDKTGEKRTRKRIAKRSKLAANLSAKTCWMP